jgi:putative ABC transport system substrate-binding protein
MKAILPAVSLALGLFCGHALAQTYTVGVLEYGTRAGFEPLLAAFKEGLAENGFVEGRNVRFEYRYADADYRKVNRLGEDLVRAGSQVIFAPTTWSVHGAKHASNTIPIVFAGVNDPVAVKFVQSLAKPGGNITGVSIGSAELTAKRIQLLREAFPSAKSIGIVFSEDAARACQVELKDIDRAGKQLGINVLQIPYGDRSSIESAFQEARSAGIQAALVPTSMEHRLGGVQLLAQSASSRIPTMHAGPEAVESGGLISYGPDFRWAYRRAGYYVARILKGTKPAELPVERPSTYELVVNLRTARAMDIKIPQIVLLRARRVIE